MNKIVLRGMEFHGFHGVFPEEATLGARFNVDVEMMVDKHQGDELDQTVAYDEVYEVVREEVMEKTYKLIESLAEEIAKGILEKHEMVKKLLVRVHKPHAPLPGVVRDIYVEIERER